MCAISACHLSKKSYSIGIDPSWYPLNLVGKEPNVSAFSTELLQEICLSEGMNCSRVTKNWSNLLESLQEKECNGVLTSLYPYSFYTDEYQFSDLFLETGPVLILREGETVRMLDDLQGKQIAVGSQADEVLLVRLYPGATVHYYNSIPEALEDLISMKIDGALVDVIPARAFVQNLYLGKVRIESKPLNDHGLRLVTLRRENQELIDRFNKGLKKIHKDGKYHDLLNKWELN